MANEKNSQVEETIDGAKAPLGNAESFIEKNKKIISAFIIGAVVGVGGWFAYKYFVAAPKELAAQEAVFKAQFYFEKDSFNLALNGKGDTPGFLAVIDDYSGTKVANTAKFYAGRCYMGLGKFDDAIAMLDGYSSGDYFTTAQALGLIGDAYSEKGDAEQALEYYKKAADKADNNLTTPVFLNKAAGILQDQKKYAEALELYTQVRDKYYYAGGGQIGQEADRNIAIVKALGNIQ